MQVWFPKLYGTFLGLALGLATWLNSHFLTPSLGVCLFLLTCTDALPQAGGGGGEGGSGGEELGGWGDFTFALVSRKL